MANVENFFILVLLSCRLVYFIFCDNCKNDDDNDDDGELFTDVEEENGNPYTDSDAYFVCAKNYSNLEDVLNFVHTPIDLVPEHVFCAYLCMADDVALVLDGDIYPDRLILYPAKRKVFNWTDYIDTKECFQLLQHYRVTSCWDWKDPMKCMSPKLLVDGSCTNARNPVPLERDPYIQDVDVSEEED